MLGALFRFPMGALEKSFVFERTRAWISMPIMVLNDCELMAGVRRPREGGGDREGAGGGTYTNSA